jgi:hypothetical protein
MKNIRRAIAILGLGGVMVAGNAFGGTITQTFTVPTSATATTVSDGQADAIFEYFGQYGLAGQTLSSVTLQFTGALTLQSLSISNADTTTQWYNETLNGNVAVNSFLGGTNGVGGTAGALTDNDALNALDNNSSAYSGPIWSIGSGGCFMGIAGSSTQTWWAGGVASGSAPALANAGNKSSVGTGNSCTPAEGTGTFTSPALASGVYTVMAGDLLDYNASGFFNLSFDATTSGSFSNGTINGGVSQVTDAVGTFQVIYNYGPSGAPEPTTMLLFGSSLVGLGLLRRRAAKR